MKARGFTLVEVTLALGIAAFCLIGLLGMLPLGASQNLEAGRATAASDVVSSVVADVRAAGSGTAQTAFYKIKLPPVTDPATVSDVSFYVTESGEYLGLTNAPVPAGRTARYGVRVRLVGAPVTRPEQAMSLFVKLWEPAALSATQAKDFTELATSVAQ